jgi:hypothetical protein
LNWLLNMTDFFDIVRTGQAAAAFAMMGVTFLL